MAIGFRAAGTPVASTSTSNSVGAPAGQAVTDENVLVVQVKPTTVLITTPTGWTKIAEHTNGVVGSSIDGGSTKIAVYTQIGIAGSATVALDSTPTFFQAVQVGLTKDPGDSWLIDYALASDTTDGANYSAGSAVNFAAVADDWILGCTALNSDAGTPSSVDISATGLTMGTTTSRVDSGSSTGEDGRLQVYSVDVVSGTETVGPVFSFTNASTSSGTTIFLRVKVTTATITVATLNPFGLTAGFEVIAQDIDPYDEFQILRVETSGRFPSEAVRGGARQDVNGLSAVITTDYEFHFTDKNGDMCVYRDDLYLYKNGVLSDVIQSDEYTPEVLRQLTDEFDYYKYPVVWIKDVHTPALNQPISVGEFEGFSRSGRVLGKYNVIDQKFPVVITDVTSGMTGEFTILVHVNPDWSHGYQTANYDYKIRELFDEGSEYYFQTVSTMVSAIEDFYFIVEDVSMVRKNRVANTFMGPPVTEWRVSFTEVERPSTLDISVGGGTWLAVDSTYASWRENDSANTSWLEMFQRLT